MHTSALDWKTFWSAFSGVASIGAGGTIAAIQNLTTEAFATSTTTGILVGVCVITAGAALTAPAIVHHADVFTAVQYGHRVNISRWAQLACAATGGNVLAYTLAPELWEAWTLAGIGLATGVYGVSRLQEWMVTHKPAPETPEEREDRRAQEKQVAHEAPEIQLFKAALREVNLDHLNVKKFTSLEDEDGNRYGVSYRVTLPAKYLDSNGKKSGGLTNAHAVSIAAGMSECNTAGKVFSPDWVEIRRVEDTPNVYDIAINRVDMMADLRPYTHDTNELAHIKKPAQLFYGRDGHPLSMRLDRHGRAIGSTESGKSSWLHRALTYLTRCGTHDATGTARDGGAIVWASGTHKVKETFGQWIYPYLGTNKKPPFDWLGQGKDDVLNQLVAAINIAEDRQDMDFDERGGEPALIVIIDEASFALMMKAMTEYLEENYTASQLAATFVKATASAGVYLWLASQRGTNDQFGDEGGTINANLQFTLVFQTYDEDDLHRIMDDWSLSPVKHPGQAWLKQGGRAPNQVKTEYVQEYNPRKTPLHDGPKVTDIAWARRHVRRELDPRAQEAAGSAYANRATNPDDMYAHLNSSKKKKTKKTTSAATVHTDAGEVELDADFTQIAELLSAKANADTGDTETAPLPPETAEIDGVSILAEEPTPVVSPQNNMETNILRYLETQPPEDESPATTRDVFAALVAHNVEVKYESVANKMSALTRAGKIQRDSDGYRLTLVNA